MSTKSAPIQSRVWRDGILEAENFPVKDIPKYIKDSKTLVWVDLHNPSKEELNQLADELSLDPKAVEDTMGVHERTKVTEHKTHIFLTAWAVIPVKRTKKDTAADVLIEPCFKKARISVFILPYGIVTVRNNDIFDMDAVLARWDDNADLIKYGTTTLVHGLLDVIVDSHFAVAQLIDDHVEMLEDGLFDEKIKHQNRLMQQRTFRVRKDLVELRRIVLPMRDVMNAVMRHRQDINASPELNSWYADLYDHVLRVAEWTDSLRDLVTAVFETNLSLQDNRLNMIMKQLTAWAAIIAIPTFVTGFFGQNVPFPGDGQEWGFLVSIGAMLIIASILYIVFRRKEWL